MEPARVLLDTDVIVNWLVRETESVTGKELWKAPYTIINLAETGKLSARISLTTLMELRFLLRRKKAYSHHKIEEDLTALTSVVDVIIPDEMSLIKANLLQEKHPLDPFDAMHLSICIGMESAILVSRDRDFIKVARHHVTAMNPEEFINAV